MSLTAFGPSRTCAPARPTNDSMVPFLVSARDGYRWVACWRGQCYLIEVARMRAQTHIFLKHRQLGLALLPHSGRGSPLPSTSPQARSLKVPHSQDKQIPKGRISGATHGGKPNTTKPPHDVLAHLPPEELRGGLLHSIRNHRLPVGHISCPTCRFRRRIHAQADCSGV